MSRTAGGTALGPAKPNQALTEKPGTPDSAIVGNSVRKAMRRARDELMALQAIKVTGNLVTLTIEDMREPDAAGDFDDDEPEVE